MITAPAGQTVTATLTNTLTTDTACTAKVFMWEKDNLKPVSDSIELTINAQDYYPDSYTDAVAVNFDKDLCGIINTGADVDIVKFTPSSTGMYAVKLTANTGTVLGLYNSSQKLLNSVTSAADAENCYLLYSLTGNQDYYLRFNGQANNSYNISPSKPSDINTVLKNTGIPDNISSIDDYNVYEFTPAATGKYVITALGTSNVKAKLYSSDYTLVSSSATGDANVSFRITSDMTANRKYYIIVEEKEKQENLVSYSLYVEEPFALISVE